MSLKPPDASDTIVNEAVSDVQQSSKRSVLSRGYRIAAPPPPVTADLIQRKQLLPEAAQSLPNYPDPSPDTYPRPALPSPSSPVLSIRARTVHPHDLASSPLCVLSN